MSPLEKAKLNVQNFGPDRVVISADGYAVPSRVAREAHDIFPEVIFIRKDGWMLGAPNQFREIAFSLYEDEWIAKWERGKEEPEKL